MASVFGDRENFDEICAEQDPAKCQQLGRNCNEFNQTTWDQNVHDVAFEVVLQKFSSTESLRSLLLSTGDALIAEATKNLVWGIGLDINNPNLMSPETWTG